MMNGRGKSDGSVVPGKETLPLKVSPPSGSTGRGRRSSQASGATRPCSTAMPSGVE